MEAVLHPTEVCKTLPCPFSLTDGAESESLFYPLEHPFYTYTISAFLVITSGGFHRGFDVRVIILFITMDVASYLITPYASHCPVLKIILFMISSLSALSLHYTLRVAKILFTIQAGEKALWKKKDVKTNCI